MAGCPRTREQAPGTHRRPARTGAGRASTCSCTTPAPAARRSAPCPPPGARTALRPRGCAPSGTAAGTWGSARAGCPRAVPRLACGTCQSACRRRGRRTRAAPGLRCWGHTPRPGGLQTAGPGARSRFGWSRAAARPGVQTTRPSWPQLRASRCSGPKRALRRGRAGAARRPGCRCRCVEQRNAQDSPEGVARGVAEPCLAPRPDPAWRRRASPLPSLMSWPTVSTCSSKGVAAYSLLGWYWLAPQHGTYLLRAGRSGGAGRRAACGRHVGACHPAPIGLKTDLSGQCS